MIKLSVLKDDTMLYMENRSYSWMSKYILKKDLMEDYDYSCFIEAEDKSQEDDIHLFLPERVECKPLDEEDVIRTIAKKVGIEEVESVERTFFIENLKKNGAELSWLTEIINKSAKETGSCYYNKGFDPEIEIDNVIKEG